MTDWKDTEIRPKNGQTVLLATWYDYWNYDVGYYSSKDDSVHFFDFNKGVETMCWEDIKYIVNKWMPFDEPEFK